MVNNANDAASSTYKYFERLIKASALSVIGLTLSIIVFDKLFDMQRHQNTRVSFNALHYYMAD